MRCVMLCCVVLFVGREIAKLCSQCFSTPAYSTHHKALNNRQESPQTASGSRQYWNPDCTYYLVTQLTSVLSTLIQIFGLISGVCCVSLFVCFLIIKSFVKISKEINDGSKCILFPTLRNNTSSCILKEC